MKAASASAPTSRRKDKRSWASCCTQVQPEDLLKFGLIPEFIGRLPVIATLHELDEDALVDILTKPKNALVKQYQKLFEMEGVKLQVHRRRAARGRARRRSTRKSGARGLRAILENAMLDIMYDIPSREDIKECVITEEVIEQGSKPLLVLKQEARVRLTALAASEERTMGSSATTTTPRSPASRRAAAPTRRARRFRCCRCATSSSSRTWSCRSSSAARSRSPRSTRR